MIPVQYAVAAYCFGHSMIRAEYELRDVPDSGGQSLTRPIFSPDGQDLRGSRPLPAELVLDWNYFFDVPGLDSPDDRNQARQIDTQVARPLHDLGLTEAGWGGKAPLWFYILKEAELGGGRRLGPVGGRIVAEVILDLLGTDRSSYFNARSRFSPVVANCRIGDLLRLAGAA
jgi:hypothetical protein